MVDNRGVTVAFLSIALLVGGLGLPGASAQAPEGTLYLTPDVTSETPSPDCQTLPRYGASLDAPASQGKAYAAMGAVLLTCPWGFDHTVASPFTIGGDMLVHLRFSCDEVLVAAAAEGATRSVIATLTKNGEAVAEDDATPIIACVLGDSVTTVDIVLDAAGTEFAAGDVLGLDLTVFAGPTYPPEVGGNLHVITGGDDPSTLTAPGLGIAAVDAAVGEARAILENLTAPAFLHDFQNATSDDYTLNFTVPWQNATLRQTAEVVSGSANVTVLRDGEVFMAFLLTNQTAPAPAGNGTDADGNETSNGTEEQGLPVFTDAAGNWSVVIDYEGFVGRLGLELAQHLPAPAVQTNGTEEPSLDADLDEGAPGPALPLLALGLLAVVAVVRRRG